MMNSNDEIFYTLKETRALMMRTIRVKLLKLIRNGIDTILTNDYLTIANEIKKIDLRCGAESSSLNDLGNLPLFYSLHRDTLW